MKRKRPGPKEERLKIDMNWRDAMKKVIKKQKVTKKSVSKRKRT